jgi:hypothetical protein
LAIAWRAATVDQTKSVSISSPQLANSVNRLLLMAMHSCLHSASVRAVIILHYPNRKHGLWMSGGNESDALLAGTRKSIANCL